MGELANLRFGASSRPFPFETATAEPPHAGQSLGNSMATRTSCPEIGNSPREIEARQAHHDEQSAVGGGANAVNRGCKVSAKRADNVHQERVEKTATNCSGAVSPPQAVLRPTAKERAAATRNPSSCQEDSFALSSTREHKSHYHRDRPMMGHSHHDGHENARLRGCGAPRTHAHADERHALADFRHLFPHVCARRPRGPGWPARWESGLGKRRDA